MLINRKHIPLFKITTVAVCLILGLTISAQTFHPYVKNKYVTQNIYTSITADTTSPPAFETVKDKLPLPIWSARQDVLKCYWKAWEIAFSNLKHATKVNGFVSPYIDPAFSGDIFMWDCTYMTMFGRYGHTAFNFQNTLNNFYAKQHPDGFICRQIRESNGTDVFERFDPSSTGPDIMPWSEWEYYKNFKDDDRLKKVFPALLAYYQWYATYRSWPDGTYYSSGWGCGMDNQKRVPADYNPMFSHGFMSWIDISFQEIYSADILIQMAKILGRENDVANIRKDKEKLAKQINENMWDENKKYYFDRFRSGELGTTKSIAAYWGLLAGSIPKDRIDYMVDHLEDTTMFARTHRVPTLSADDPNFNPNGGYWNGSVWAPTTYMVLRGLTKYGYDSLAYQIASNHLDNVVKVFNKTNTLWENYAPDKVQGNNHTNFVGWTGLVPINDLFEYVFGIRPDVPNNKLLIDVNLTDEYGVKDYPFGIDGSMDILCKKRKSKKEKPSIIITTNVPLKLIVKWAGNEFTVELKKGKNIV